ncbi:glycosyltransferase family 2 protein [Alkaliphilus peptidifermentans]|uniref:Glycosyltransferase, catalytic subunit of cellulose synthase and poly-beta-1,6-N-acetylglucosamine synthase n=1 Tax=Alkaliphilus peptidifermentans DSM 18978 TaxID=1120976 RepID=A0A1G5G4P0_9FIRM|nr:glycosyltransferase [Alkaliphilus peptidifermentans]SCY45678.1 Glycosyltransferase, catalytic subunit of cellulose synthase and poly-beta-1,6-N-acetylglucosamine synthase [Alkaliphilus peptidifermentans DSM 18978]
MRYLFLINTIVFLVIILYYSILTIYGLYYRTKARESKVLDTYPSVDILIPAHNEGKVIQKTLDAIIKLDYPGEVQIYLLNDNSKDDTGIIAEAFAKAYNNLHHIKVPKGEPRGKSRVLNYGLSISNSLYFVVYDADNQPEVQSLRLLVEAAVKIPNSAGAVGYVRTINENKNLLTRMISLEFQVFQLLMQSGRWVLFNTGSLTGTNMLVKRSTIDKVGNYDVFALAEDAELTLRITNIGQLLPIVPEAITWEQEPEEIKVLIKQRTRWLHGNLYLLEKMFSSIDNFKGKMLVHSLQQVLVYIVFLTFLMLSHGWFIAGLLGFFNSNIQLPFLLIWYMSYLVYTSQVFSAQVVEKTVSPINMAVGFISYFTYCQLFIFLFFRSLFFYIKAKKQKKVISWDKTIRF